MKAFSIASKSLRIFLWLILGILLLLFGIVAAIYTPWAQSAIKDALVQSLNSNPDMAVELRSIKLAPPLKLNINGLTMSTKGDTIIAANALEVNVRVLPLLKGTVEIDRLFLEKARYQLGNADSAIMMVLKADTLEVSPASVKLGSMDIDLKDGRIAHASVSMISRPDTAAAQQSESSQQMKIRVKTLQLEDFVYKMSMLPTIDSLGTTIGRGTIKEGTIDLKAQTINIKSVVGTRLSAAYIAPDAEQIASVPALPTSDSSSMPWTIKVDSIHFDNSKALYTTHGLLPQPGLDFAYIQADSMDLSVTDFYNQATIISLPLKLSAIERCGVNLTANGTFSMDSLGMYFNEFELLTANNTLLKANGMMGIGSMTEDPALPLQLEARGRIAVPDLRLMFPAFGAYLAGFSDSSKLVLDVDAEGTAGDIALNTAEIEINGVARVKAKGRIRDMFAESGPNGNLALSGNIFHAESVVESMLKGSGISIPPMTILGNIAMNNGAMKGNMKANALDGKIVLDASLNTNSQRYDISLSTEQFPVNAFMNDLGVGRATLTATAKGNGFDLFKSSTNLDATVHAPSVAYKGYNYTGIDLTAALHGGNAAIDASVHNHDVQASLNARGNLSGEAYNWTAKLNGDRIDLKAINFSQDEATLSVDLIANASFRPSTKDIEANLTLNSLDYFMAVSDYSVSNIQAKFASADSLTTLTILNRDFHASVDAPYGIDSLMTKADSFSALFNKQMSAHNLKVDSLQMLLPRFSIAIVGGANNFLNDILAESNMSIRRINFMAQNDSLLNANGSIINFQTGAVMLDTISIDLRQRGGKLNMLANIDNRPGTLDQWAHIRFNGILGSNQLAFRAAQKDIQNVTGYDIGAIVALMDSTVNARIFPLTPTIGYKKWKVNLDNYISYNIPTNHVSANLKMTGEHSSLALYTEQPADTALMADGMDDIVLKLNDVRVEDWIAINPFAPPIAGNLSADVRMHWNGGENVNGKAMVSLDQFFYDKEKVGDFVTNIDIATGHSGMVRAEADLIVNGQKAMALHGNLNDSTASSPFNLDLEVIKFPLSIVNPFMPQDMARLNGTLNGKMDVNGDAKRPILNGDIYFDKAAVKMAMTNTSYAISDVHIPVVDNLVQFNDFAISGANENPLTINGFVKLSPIMSPSFNLTLNANNMMIVNSTSAAKNAVIYGNASIDLDATIKGNMKFMSVDADLSVLSGTNATYVMSPTVQTLQESTQTDMVKFVNFSDSTMLSRDDSLEYSSMLMSIDASLTIQSGTVFTVDLPTGTRDKVELQPQGTVNYTQSPLSDGRLTGRININNGFARYTIPIVGVEKSFNFDPGSYVAFNGNMLNPVLNIHVTDVIKTNVTQSGQNSRLVNFDVMLGITGTLDQMDVKFDLSTNDDLTVANELQSMTEEQRANQAMNLLLYNMYTGPGTKGSGMAGNPLFSFLEGKINSWAANNIKGVNLQFGIDQYNQTTNGATSSTMSYSYQVSKSLFNNRFKIVIGGNYTTDDNPDENLSQNLINDISFEYFLNVQQTMLVKLFRHTGYESILEGEITQTGVGFIYKRKINHLSQMLPKFMRPRKFRRIE